MQVDRIRFSETPLDNVPPRGFVDFFYDRAQGVFVFKDYTGATQTVGTGAAVTPLFVTDPVISAANAAGQISFNLSSSTNGQGITVNGITYPLKKTSPNPALREWGTAGGYYDELSALLEADGVIYTKLLTVVGQTIYIDVAAQTPGPAGDSISVTSNLDSASITPLAGGLDAEPQADYAGQMVIRYTGTHSPADVTIHVASKAGQAYWAAILAD